MSANQSASAIPRRDFLVQAGALPLLGVRLADVLQAHARFKPAPTSKSVLFLFLSGGPPHLDLGDMKPDAPAEIRGEFQPSATAATGIRLCEHLPRLAQRTSQRALLRSLSHASNDHEVSMYRLLTGQHDVPVGFKPKQPSRVDFPSLATMAGLLLPARDLPAAAILPYLIIHQTAGLMRPGQLAGMLGPRNNPWVVEAASKCTGFGNCPNCFHYLGAEVRHEPEPIWSLPDTFQLSESLASDRFQERLRLLQSIETQQRSLDKTAATEPLDRFRTQAATLLTSGKVHRAFDLAKEPDRLRKSYGQGQFGQSLVLARRLLEAGVRLVQVNLGNLETWDTHSGNFIHLRNDLLPPFDRAVSGLLDDLAARGLLDETLVVLAGEFGCTPRINNRARPGRDHWGMANTMVLPSGGVRGGQVIGATDAIGASPTTEPYAPAEPTCGRPVGAEAEPSFRSAAQTVAQDWGRLRAYLHAQGCTLRLEPAPCQFAGGLGNLNYLIEVDGTLCVLRRPPPGPIPPGANDMARENRVLQGLWRRFAYAPRGRLYCADPAVLGAHFLIMEYRPGRVIGGQFPPELDAHAVGEPMAAALVRLLAELHAVDPDEVGLGDFGKPQGFLERTIEGWAKRALIATEDRPRPALTELADWLRRHRVPDRAPTLLHSDFKLDNVVWDSETLEPRAVLDWDMATRGDPLLDLATLLSYWAEAGDPPAMRELGQMPTAQEGFPSRRAVVAAYAARTGRDVSDILFHRVLAMFKLGIAFLQLYARYRAGTTRDERFAGFESLAYGILDFTQEIARGRAF